jgi:hypothetical protein
MTNTMPHRPFDAEEALRQIDRCLDVYGGMGIEGDFGLILEMLQDATAEVLRSRFVAAQAYQAFGALADFAGAFGTEPVVRMLDNLDAASSGDVIPHDPGLPFHPVKEANSNPVVLTIFRALCSIDDRFQRRDREHTFFGKLVVHPFEDWAIDRGLLVASL